VRVEVVAFAALREALGSSRLTLEFPAPVTGEDVRQLLAERHPRYGDLIRACRLAQGVEFLEERAVLRDGDEVILIPPVSGGSHPPAVELTMAPLDGEALKAAAFRDAAGAVVVFEGTVRSPSEGRDVRFLEYEAYEPMARSQMERIVEEVRERWPVSAVYLHHRLGRIEVGEASVVAVASAPHRPEAFEACRHLIERLKADVPIWKKEFLVDGSVWVGAPGECAHDGGSV
jgi:molybdopterin synthase catalytic subunit